MRRILTLFVLISAILSIQTVCAQQEEQIVVNSADWIDVYSAMCYANLNGLECKFVSSEAQAAIIPSMLDRTKTINLIESERVPFIVGYKDTLEKAGFNVYVTRSESGRSMNFELASKINTTSFIVVDDDYGYNAIAVAPYAVKSNSWVLFVDKDNIDDVYAFLKKRGVESLIIYGRVDEVVKDKLSEFSPTIIDEGSRFDDNIEIVKRYMEISPSTQVVLTNGEFIEDEIMSGRNPVLFIGRDEVPDQVIQYVKESGIKLGVLIGNDLTASAKRLKDRTGMYIFIKFGQGREQTGGMSLVETLDMFYLPAYELSMDVLSANYNEATRQLEIIYKNNGSIGTFFSSSIGVYADGERVATVGNSSPQFIDADTEFGMGYDLDIDYVRGKELKATVYVEYGEAPKSLNMVLQKDLPVGIIEVPDNSEIEISKVAYDKNTERVKAYISNTGEVPCYVYPELELILDGDEEILRIKEPMRINPGDTKDAVYRIGLSNADLADNAEVSIHTLYGEREKLLVKCLDGRYPLEIAGGIPIIPIAVAVLAALLAVLLFFWERRRRKKGSE